MLRLWLAFVGLGAVRAAGPLVTLTTGQAEGFYISAGSGRVAAFVGLPYATPPVGSLRFKKPEAPAAWDGVRKANSYGPACPQPPSTVPSGIRMDEDCLYLNVYTPLVPGIEFQPNNTKIPVMVFIHGGGFTTDTGAAYRYPANLVNKGVVLVTINYRLGPLGFFTTNTTDFPPNLGMLDQLRALRWVKKEIGVFGGDSKAVTIFGESAGGGSVSLLTYSPMAKGMFHRAIMESGNAFAPWAVEGNANYFYNSSRALAVGLGCRTEQEWNDRSWGDMGSCLRKVPWQRLWNVSFTYAISVNPLTVWGPCVDGAGGFLPDWPVNLASSRDPSLPVLLGTNLNEAATSPFVGQLLYGAANLSDFTNEATFNLFRDFSATQAEYGAETESVRDFLTSVYVGWNAPLYASQPILWLESTVQMMSDKIAFSTARKEAQLWLNNNNPNIYIYSFDYVSDGFPYSQGYTPVFHAEELMFIFPGFYNETFGSSGKSFSFTQNDRFISEQFGAAWTNFAKTGAAFAFRDPNKPMALASSWKPAGSAASLNYLSLTTASSMKSDYHKSGGRVWNSLLPALTRATPTCPPANARSPLAPLPSLLVLLLSFLLLKS